MLQTGYLIIADISGYTDFIRLHNMRKKPIVGNSMANMFEAHADKVISDLLEAVIDAMEPDVQLNKLEGDAAFFFCNSKSQPFESDKIIEAMERGNEAFKEKASELVFIQACGCDPCLQSKNLRLKMVAHRGEFTIQKIRNFEELAGEDVILTHRMLKNSIKSNEYWLVTESFLTELSVANKKKFSKTVQKLESFGKTTLNYLEFESTDPQNEKIEGRSQFLNFLIQAAYFTKPSIKRLFLKK